MRTRRQLKAMFPDPRMRELIDSLWREIHDNNVIEGIVQLSHGFETGEAVKIDKQSSLWIRPMADTIENAGTEGFVCRIISADAFDVRVAGLLPGEYLTGANYFLSTTVAGSLMMLTDPEIWAVGQVREFVGTGSPDGLLIAIDLGDVISEDIFKDKYVMEMAYDIPLRKLTLKRSANLPDLEVTIPLGVILHAVALSGSYNDLVNKPSLFSGSYADLSGKPDLAKAFTELTDVIPENYLGRKNAIPMVVELEDKLDLVDTEELLTEAARFPLLADCPPSYTGMGGYFVRVKSDETGLEFIAP
jgi:hypothetical protein